MRAFIAIPVEPYGDLLEAVNSLREIKGLKVPKGNILHLTLSFLGDIEEDLKKDLCEKIPEIQFRKFSLNFDHIGAFPKEGKARVIFAGTPSKEILELHDLIEEILPRSMIEERKFVAHLTLARTKFPYSIYELKKRYENADLGTYKVDRVCLYKSVLRPEGPEYTEMCCNQLM